MRALDLDVVDDWKGIVGVTGFGPLRLIAFAFVSAVGGVGVAGTLQRIGGHVLGVFQRDPNGRVESVGRLALGLRRNGRSRQGIGRGRFGDGVGIFHDHLRFRAGDGVLGVGFAVRFLRGGLGDRDRRDALLIADLSDDHALLVEQPDHRLIGLHLGHIGSAAKPVNQIPQILGALIEAVARLRGLRVGEISLALEVVLAEPLGQRLDRLLLQPRQSLQKHLDRLHEQLQAPQNFPCGSLSLHKSKRLSES